MKDLLINRVARALECDRLMTPDARVVIGVSGGSDSVVLAHVLTQCAPRRRLQLVLAHVNYGLRGTASDQDEAFVRAYAKRLGWACYVKRAKRKGGSGKPEANNRHREGSNVQAWAREVRYRFFAQVARRVGAGVVAVAHHQDDQAETVLMNLIRGAGIAGLAGMAPQRVLDDDLLLIRPLLGVSRAELLRYAKRHSLAFCRDATNISLRYQRNRIRRQLLPLLGRLNPRAIAHIGAAAERLREEGSAVDAMASAAWPHCCRQTDRRRVVLDRMAVSQLPTSVRRRILQRAYGLLQGNPNGLGLDHLVHMEAVAGGRGRKYGLPGPIVIERAGRIVRLRPGRP